VNHSASESVKGQIYFQTNKQTKTQNKNGSQRK